MAQPSLVITPDIKERFEAKFSRGDGCWLWQASTVSGYGQFMYRKRPLRAHRVSWEMYRGAVPQGMHVLHRCDTPNCVNPDHLFLGTNADNMADKIAKRRHRNGTSPGVKNGRATLTESAVRAIRSSSDSTYALGRKYHLHPSTIGKIKKGLLWKSV